MNIIQLQDRLKGVSDQALVGYVENPTGDVPTYLALGELQRRKTMRERYEAQKEPTSTVAEQLVEETKPQGIAQVAQPQPEMTPDMVASSGVGALPAGNIGQNYAGGGIIAFADGGETSDYIGDAIGGALDTAGLFAGRIFGPVTSAFWPSELGAADKYSEEELAAIMADQNNKAKGGIVNLADGGVTSSYQLKDQPWMPDWLKPKSAGVDPLYHIFMDEEAKQADADLKRQAAKEYQQQKAAERKDLEGASLADRIRYGFENILQPTFKTEDIKELQGVKTPPKEEEVKTEAPQPKPDLNKNTTQEVEKDMSMKDYAKEFQDLLGENTYQKALDERMKKMDKSAEERERRAPWMAVMEAGLAMAAGQSPDAISNIAAGATRGIKSYQDHVEAMQAIEEKRTALLTDMAKADRAEKIAAVEYGLNSKQFKETQRLKDKIADQEAYFKSVDIKLKEQDLVLKQFKNNADVAKDIIDTGVMEAWKTDFLDRMGDEYEGTPQYFQAYQMELDRLSNQRQLAGTGTGSGLKLVGERKK